MAIRIDHYHHFDALRVEHVDHQHLDAALRRVERALVNLGEQQMATAQELRDAIAELTQKVADQKGDIESMKTFVGGLEAAITQELELKGASDEILTAVKAVFVEVGNNSQAIKNAIDSDPATN